MAKLKESIQKSGVPRRFKTNNLLLLTWNIAQFHERKPKQAIKYMAYIMKRFDIIAIQEVKDNLGGIEQLQKELGKNYRFIFSDISGNYERLVFCYYKRNVTFTGLAAEVVKNPGKGREKTSKPNKEFFGKVESGGTIKFKAGNLNQKRKIRKIIELFSNNKRIDQIEIDSSDTPIRESVTYRGKKYGLKVTKFQRKKHSSGNDKNGYYLTLKYDGDKTTDIIISDKTLEFDRTPYVVSFSKNGCNFVVTNVHIFYGSGKAVRFRKQELKMLAEYLDERSSDADALDPDYIACGDFNIEEAIEYEKEHADPNTINTNHSITEITDSLFDALTSKELKIPDIIRKSASNLDQTKHYDQIGYHEYDDSTISFRDGGVINFVGAVFPELGENPLDVESKRNKLKKYLSDHLPMWAEFAIIPDPNPIKIN